MNDAVDITLATAFFVGLVSFISPCVLPLVPGYISTVTGVSFAKIEHGGSSFKKVLLPASCFCLSFSAVFMLLGMTATGLGSTLQTNREFLSQIAGVTIIGLGIFFLLTPFVTRLNRQWRPQRLLARVSSGGHLLVSGGPVLAGAAFAFAWTPCIGPTLGAILAAASTQATVGKGAMLLGAYSAGLAIPFLITAIAFNKVWRLFRWFRNHYLVITSISGAILVAMGVLMLTGKLTMVNAEVQRLISSFDLNIGGA
jgi:cytochrome c-type biogenesis protein